tara:strand:+ start:838 stop:1056 length:219 start_codon:yes stop_codon:yes gene_type:complete
MIEDIIKHLRKKDKTLSQKEAEAKAEIILNKYNKQNEARDEKREEEHQRQWNKALKSESYNTLFEYMDDEEE